MNHQHIKTGLLAGTLALLSACQVVHNDISHTNTRITAADYQRAEQLLPVNLKQKVENLTVEANWLEDGLWYTQTESGALRYWRIKNTRPPELAFDHHRLASQLASLTDATVSADTLELNSLTFKDAGFRFQQAGLSFFCQEEPLKCEIKADAGATESRPSITAKAKEKVDDSMIELSPNKQWKAFINDYDLYLEKTSTGKKIRLTDDGEELNRYGQGTLNPNLAFNKPHGRVEPDIAVYWSKNSRYLITFQLDLRRTGKLTLTQSVPESGYRPRSYEYHYPAAGDKHIPKATIVLFDTKTQKPIKVNTPAVFQTYYGSPLWGGFEDDGYFYYVDRSRGFHNYYLRRIDPRTGLVDTLITETNEKFIDPWAQDYWVLKEGKGIIWTSERSGYQHLYLYDSKGQLKRPLTTGNLIVRVVRSIDEDNQRIYFEASGAEHQGDEYYRYLYRVDFDGKNLTRLTAEPAMHTTQVSPDHQYFVDTFSTVNQPPVHLLRRTEDGKTLAKLGEADLTGLQTLGYRPPEPFTVKASDGTTNLYGVLYLPSHFDPEKTYPVLNDIYTGPHGFFTPKSYGDPLGEHAVALAELGFIVFKMDGRGTGKRSRAFHEKSYHNLGGGVDDHVWALKQLAQTKPYLDLSRVGIYGFSAGGYDTAHALFKYPDFFKVGVSASGNHDFRVDKTGWNEAWMGYPVGPHWDEQSNLNWARHLQGKLLVAHGELDSNVHPGASLQLVDALIKANKDFDFLIYPNMGHVLHNHPYFVRKRWDYFIEHLMGAQPPAGYKINSMETPAL